MSAASDLLRAFYEGYRAKAGRPVAVTLADKLLNEEMGELDLALDAFLVDETRDRKESVARELADVAFTLYGLALALGIDLDEALRLVGEANLAKLAGGKVGKGGKLGKPAGWRAPDMSGALWDHS